MKITELQAYKRLTETFKEKGYSEGIEDKTPCYSWENRNRFGSELKPGHYVDAIGYGYVKLKDVPKEYRTRGFFLHSLSASYDDIVEYVKMHPEEFDRQFFKDHIATNYYSLEFENNDFEYMPLEFIDEELVMCAMLRAVNMRYCDRRGDCDDWFYSVYRRKPEVLTQDMYILGARCFAAKRGKNEFLDITPEEFRTEEYYFALCQMNNTPVMEDIPQSILTNNFLVKLVNDCIDNIRCFTDEALEREVPMKDHGVVKIWQAVIMNDGYQIGNIPLNDERIEYFLSMYDKDSGEYEVGFKSNYKRYLREKNSIPEPPDPIFGFVSQIVISGAKSGMGVEAALDLGTAVAKSSIGIQTRLPIFSSFRVPKVYSKKYDKEEYLVEIYKKLGIQVLQEADYYYYNVVLPENLSIVDNNYGYGVKDLSNDEILIHYYDRGPFYDRTVTVDEINVTL